MLIVFSFKVFLGFLLTAWLQTLIDNAKLVPVLRLDDIYTKMKRTMTIILVATSRL